MPETNALANLPAVSGLGLTEFETYLRHNSEFIPNFGERYRNGEAISTAFVESTINQVASKRFVKKQSISGHSEVLTSYCRRGPRS